MKRSILIFLFCALFGISSAQLKVADTGKVGINVGTATPVSNLSVNSAGNSNSALFVNGGITTIWAECTGTGSPAASWIHSASGQTAVMSNRYSVGLRGQSQSASPSTGRAFGVMGIAGNSTSGYNYGVFGTTYGTQNGAGIVGTTNSNVNVNIPGLYAGYFDGDIKVTGLINGVTIPSSDVRLKQNISDLGTAIPASKGVSTLNTVLQMIPVEYSLKQQYIESTGDSATVQQALYDEKSQLFQKKHYGLIAQDLQELYPDLVYEGDDGFLGIHYTGIIPLLIQSIKELKTEVDELRNSDPSLKKASVPGATLSPEGTGEAVLHQNAPNPFNFQTKIGFEIPSSVSNAQLHVCNMNGVLLKTIQVNQRGEGAVTISANEFAAGLYLYSLVCDGSMIDTKRMLLTE